MAAIWQLADTTDVITHSSKANNIRQHAGASELPVPGHRPKVGTTPCH